MSTKQISAKRIKLNNVRLSFPSVFKKASFEGKVGKFEATFLIPKKDKKTLMELKNEIKRLLSESKLKIPPERFCLKNGDDYDYEGYAGCYALKASNNRRPNTFDRDMSALSEDDDKLYAGCYVNGIIEFWIQNNQYGKRVNANLLGLQFVNDGEPFGNGPIDVSDDFDSLETESGEAGDFEY